MIDSPKKPGYISSSPSGKDLFEGKSHEKISSTIFELIRDKSLPNNVIGIEGKWGSGKSNVISIIDKKFSEIKSDYFFFTYDAWGHQEDLTRRTFLEELIFSLKSEGKFKGNIDWTQKLARLLARKSKKSTSKFPKIKFYWILIMASVLLFSFLNVIYNDFLIKNDFIPSRNLHYWKLFLSKYLFPLVLFCWGLVELIKEYRAFNNNIDTQDFDYKERLKRLLYIFSGSNLESNELEHILENEPTVKSFKEYFESILEDLKSDGLIIVFDNMDRLSKSEKVLSLWSSIHTFFAEEKIENVCVIIPYDKEHLAKHFDENDVSKVDNFIGKTFSTIFRISPPVLSDWKKFFELKMKEAFHDIINDNDIDFISSLYELITDVSTKRPRDIITFINNLVSLYLQHNNSIDIKYLALFTLRKKEILDNPLISISGKHFLKEEKHMFQADSELEESLAAIVYNVDKNKSSEVLLTNSIDDIFIKANFEALREVKKHSEFKTYFGNKVNKSNFSNSWPHNTAKIFEEVNDVISELALKSYWERFANSLDSRPEEEFIILLDWHKSIIKNTSRNTARMLADKIVYKSKRHFEKSSDGSKYYSTIYNLVVFINSENIKIKASIDKVKFSAKDFISYLDDLYNIFEEGKCTFQDLKIYTESEELNTYFIDHENGFVEELYNFIHVIEYLKVIDKSYKFKKIQDAVDSELSSVVYTDVDKISNLIKINKVLNKKDSFKLIPQSIGTNFLNYVNTKIEEPYIDIVANQIAHLMTINPQSTVLSNELNKLDNARAISEVIQFYISYGDLLKVVIEQDRNYPLLEEIIKLLTTNDYGFTQKLHVKWVFENLDYIKSNFFGDNFKRFLTQFDGWKRFFNEEVIPAVFNLRKDILKETFDFSNHDFSSIKLIYNEILNEFRDATKEDWLNYFNTDSNFYNAFIGLVNNNLLDKKITRNKIFMQAYEEYLIKIVKDEESIPEDIEIWNNLLNKDYLDKRKLNRIYDDILDLLIKGSELDVHKINFFAIGIFQYSTVNSTKADDICRKIILRLRDDDSLSYNILKKYGENIINIINMSKGTCNQDLLEMFNQILEDERMEKETIENILNQTKLEIPKKDFQDKNEEIN